MATEEIERNEASPDALVAKFAAWDKRLDHHWSPWRKEARTAYDLVAGRQWEDAEEKELEERNRLAPVFNKLAPLIDAVSGAEIAGRQEVRYFPREAGDSAVNELLTKGAAWIRDRCDADQEESEAFRDVFICGIGCTESAMDYDEEPEGETVVERIDPLEVHFDPSCRKSNAKGARYLRRRKPMSKDAYEEAFPTYADIAGHASPYSFDRLHVNNPQRRYEGGDDGLDVDGGDDGEILVDEYQWFDREPYWLVIDPDTGRKLQVSEEEYAQINGELRQWSLGELDGVKLYRRRYWRAFVCGNTVLGDPEELPAGEFSYKFITGKRDRNRRSWYGLVRAMKDPQKWLNQFLSQLIAIMGAATKGGAVVEEDAVSDWPGFENSWAGVGGVSKVKPGRLGSVKEKPASTFPAGLHQFMGLTTDAMRETSGVNPEMLGQVDRDQAGVLEYQRKQAAYGIMACYFDSFRRYRREQGRLMLKLFRFLPEGYLVRIVDEKSGLARYVEFAVDEDVHRFDVIVDEAPAGPNQKAQVWNMIVQLMPYLKDADLPPAFWADVARYSPFPTELANSMQQHLLQAGQQQPDPMAARAAEAEVRGKEAKAGLDEAKAEESRADAITKMAGAAAASAAGSVALPPNQLAFGEEQLA